MNTIEKIKKMRRARNMSQQTLADAAGIARQSYGRIESGKNSPSIDTIERIVLALDCEIQIVGRKDNHKTNTL